MTLKKKAVLFSFFVMCIILVSGTIASAGPGGGYQKYYVNGYIKTTSGSPIYGASVALKINGVYFKTVTSQLDGKFSASIYTSVSPRSWYATVSKSGYYSTSKYKTADIDGTTEFGDIKLTAIPPPPTNYFIHGYVKNIYNDDPISGASVKIYREAYEGWSLIGSVFTDQNGYYSDSYSTYDALSSCRVEASAVDYYDNYREVSATGSDIDMGILNLFYRGGAYSAKYAVLVGINDYEDEDVDDLRYSDEDIEVWYDYLTTTLDYLPENIWVYGDGYTDATEANVKSALEYMVALADMDDIVCFIMSGHGGKFSSEPDGSVFLGMYDYESTAEEGTLRDSEIADIFEDSVAATNFFFFSTCHSGGIGPDLMALDNAANTLVLTACGWEGSGWDYPIGDLTPIPLIEGGGYTFPETGYSLWTYWFLVQGLEAQFGYNPTTTMEDAFEWARDNYPEGTFTVTINGNPFEWDMEDDYEPEIYPDIYGNTILY